MWIKHLIALGGLGLGIVAMSGMAAGGKNCTCRAQGHDYQLGDVLCIRGHLSQCQMDQNVTSWKEIADECPLTSRPAPRNTASLPPLQQRFN